MSIDYWISNSGSLIHQIFMITMGFLYTIAYILNVSYKAINIYAYFILYPLSLSNFLLKGWKRFLFLPISLLFFAYPNFENISNSFFNNCVVFLNKSASLFNSNYVEMSVYLCVLVPVMLYLPLIFLKYRLKGLLYTFLGLIIASGLYLMLIFPYVEPLLNTYF